MSAVSIVRAAAVTALIASAAPAFGDVSDPAAAQRPAQSVLQTGQTVNFAQALAWLDADHFAVGRWDGSITVFRRAGPNEYGPVLTQAMSTPSGRGIEMLASIDPATFVTSDGDNRLAVWRRPQSSASFLQVGQLAYDSSIGAANSGLALTLSGTQYFVTGHASGNVLVWRSDGASFVLAKTIDMRSSNPIPSPYQLRNIRGLAAWREATVVTASEDGDIAAIDILTGQEAFRSRFNPDAKRGINNISLVDERLLVANCSVGPADKNIWLFDLSSGAPRLIDAENLALDLNRSQTFNFDVDLASDGAGGLAFFSDTEEGLLWQGRVEADQLVVTGVAKVSSEGGAIAAISPLGDVIALASGAIRIFKAR